MAIGAMTKNSGQSAGSHPGPLFVDTISFTGDAAYATGGTDILTPFQALVGSSRDIVAVMPAGDCGGFVPIFDTATGKLKVFTSNGAAPAALAEFTNAGDLSATTFDLLVLSK